MINHCSQLSLLSHIKHTVDPQKRIDRDRTRTCNPQIRSLVPYPLGHTVLSVRWISPIKPSLTSYQRVLQSSVNEDDL